MIFAVLCACQLVATRGELVMLHGDAASKAKLTSSGGVSYVGWSDLQKVGARLRSLPSGRASLELAGLVFEVTHGVPFVRIGDRVVPLAAPPRLSGDTLALPLQFLAQLMPRFSPEVSYNSVRRTLSVAATTAAARGPNAISTTVEPVAGRGRAAGSPTNKPAAAAAARRLIVVDAGHGGPDEGTSVTTRTGARITEKSITLTLSTLLGEELKKRSFDVVYTRARDTLIALQDRGRIANARQGSAFISVHVNSAGSAAVRSSARGVETYFLSVARTEDAKRLQMLENSSVRFEEFGAASNKGDPLSFILTDMQQNDHLRESANFAEQVQKTLSGVHPGGNRGVKQAEFAVLVGAFMPSVLVEVGFLSNESDASFMVNKSNQKKMAVAIADATASYFKAYDRRVVASGDGR